LRCLESTRAKAFCVDAPRYEMRLQLCRGPCISLRAVSICLQVFASLLFPFSSKEQAFLAATTTARSPCVSNNCRAYSWVSIACIVSLIAHIGAKHGLVSSRLFLNPCMRFLENKSEGTLSAPWGNYRERPPTCASKKPKLLSNMSLQCLFKSKTENR